MVSSKYHREIDTSKVISIICTEGQAEGDIQANVCHLRRADPALEDAPVEKFTSTFEDHGVDVVVFGAGAGEKGDPARIKAVDYLGALKVFDAIEAVERAQKPRLILISATDIRDPNKIPDHYNEADIEYSRRARPVAAHYCETEYEADKNLVQRTTFKWTIRDDVAKTIALLVDRPDAAGLALDVVGGETPLEEGLDVANKNRVTAWVG
ncbi:hypothetical protein K474DRAFT_1694007 [Panus rudis PR-1116 ss-1]|nr:hypothetical protein K474DRAFT_1694007 [Panus rudis PR-1116 ss-1]